jgi:concanavalin A-like lectin/glucanase superfamily protein
MARIRTARGGAVTAAAIAALAAPAAASAAPVSVWHLDETSGTTVADGLGVNPGTRHGPVAIGQPGVLGTAYAFPGQPAIVNVPTSPSLNPGSASFSVTLSFNTSVVTRDDSADIIRKGTTTNSRTLWKVELRPSSTRKTEQVRCYFRGSSATVGVYGGKNVADGRWHTVTCSKQAGSVSVVLDGRTRSKATRVGSISNSAPLTIGAKASNDDAYQGLVDEVSFAR